jgi:hypothetical protein
MREVLAVVFMVAGGLAWWLALGGSEPGEVVVDDPSPRLTYEVERLSHDLEYLRAELGDLRAEHDELRLEHDQLAAECIRR